MSPSPSLLSKYNKLWVLSQRGAPHEAENAHRAMQRMESQHPGIGRKASSVRSRQAPPPPEPRHWSESYREVGPDIAPEAEPNNWKDKASSFFKWAASTAHDALSTQELQEWAEQVDLNARENKSGSITFSIKFNPQMVWMVERLSQHHRLMFTRLVCQMAERQIYEYLEKPS